MRRGLMLGGAAVVAMWVGGCDEGAPNPATVPATKMAETKAALSLPAATKNAEGFTDVTVAEFEQLAKQRGVVMLDVQPDDRYAKGFIAGSVHYNGTTLAPALATMDKNATYLVYCTAGVLSVSACRQMAGEGFKNLYNLQGGIRAWKDSGKPVETPATGPAETRPG
jgi:rhodanese-related sulfurtransferase